MRNDDAFILRARVENLTWQLNRAKTDLADLERACPHEWEDKEPRVDVVPGFHMDAEGHGSDFYPSYDVPEQRTVYYRRACKTCGKTEETKDVVQTTVVNSKPKWKEP